MNAYPTAKAISDYLLLGAHHSTELAQRVITEIVDTHCRAVLEGALREVTAKGAASQEVARQLAETLEKDVPNRAVHPDIALRVALVALAPIRAALKRYNSER